jgi:hypothetical protein
MTKRPTIRELRKHLGTKSAPDLIDEIVALYTKYDSVKDFYALQYSASYGQELLERYKAIITTEFFPPNSRRPGSGRIAVARRAVTDYQKLTTHPEHIADLMLHYVEIGVAYTRSYGDINASFYASMERMYAAAINHVVKHDIQAQFFDRLEQIMRRADGTGWGFHENLMQLFYEGLAFPEDAEDET